MHYKVVDFIVKGDERGSLVAIEKGNNAPFEIKRVYYIFGTKRDAIRGQHAHKDLEQLIVCISGSCDFTLDNGKSRELIHLNTPDKGIYVKNIWCEFTNFSDDCVVMVIASEKYDEEDYIRDYDEYLKVANK